jgi:U6 snRNA-associated Sm-like protein LSm1
LVLEDTVERIYHGNAYAENWHGLFLIRGENVVLLGEVVRPQPFPTDAHSIDCTRVQDLDQEDEVPLRRVEYSVLEPYHKNDTATKKKLEDNKSQILYEQKGFCREGGEGDGY